MDKQQSNFGVIVSARMGSSRLPGKALKPLFGKPMILALLDRLRPLGLDRLVLATTDLPEDDVLARLAADHGYACFRGSNEDVANRLIEAACEFHFDYVVRVTGDCPWVDANLVQHAINIAIANPFDLVTTKGVFPQGLDCEIFETRTLKGLHQSGALTNDHKEHVTLYYYDHADEFRIRSVPLLPAYAAQGKIYTVDTPEDYEQLLLMTKDEAISHFAEKGVPL